MPPDTERISVRTTNVVTALIVASATLYFLAFLTQNLAPAILGLFISLFIIYQRVAFSSKIKRPGLTLERNVLSKINFIGSPITMKVKVSADIPNMRILVEDSVPEGMVMTKGSNRFSFISTPGKTHEFTYSVKGDRRGYYNFETMNVTCMDKRGLFRAEFEEKETEDVLVHTDIESIKQAKVLAKRHSMEIMGKTPTRMARSRAAEYEGVREYQAGDRMRALDWKASSRLTKLMSKIFDAESTIPVTMLLDCSRSMRKTVFRSSKLDYGTNSAIQLLKVLQSRGHPIGLLTFDENKIINHTPPDVKRDQYNLLIDMLKELPQTLKEEAYTHKGPKKYKLGKGRKLEDSERTFLRKVSPFVSQQSVDAEDADRFKGVYLGVQRIIRTTQRGSLLILISDLETDIDTVHSALKLARVKRNKVYVIAPYSPWFGLAKKEISVKILEDMYEEYVQKQNAETVMRKIGVDVINVGPRTPGAELVARLRRYAT